MSEFEATFKIESSKYDEIVIVQKYGDGYKILAGKASNKADGTHWLRWVFPQGKDKQPMEKAIPLQINLGNIVEAHAFANWLKATLPVIPGQGQNRGAALAPKPGEVQEDIQF